MALTRQAAELERLRVACQVASLETIPKAQEILRLMDSKCRPGALGRGDMCRTLVAFDLACRALSCPVPPKTAAKLSGSPSEAVYVAALGTAQRLLGVQRRYTCEEIAESVGGKRVGTMAATELKRYKERFLSSYPAKQVASIDLDGTVYAVSAFYLCAKKLKHPVDKQRLLDLCLVREPEFNAVCRSMLDLCYSTLGVSVSDKPSAERLAQFSKAAALGNSDNDRLPPSAAGAASEITPLATVTSAPLLRRGGGGGGGGGSGGRRPIPLSGGRGGPGAPRSHMAALARSIQAAAQRKRSGGTTVALAEPEGSNEANNALHDRTHRPAANKRPRHPVPAAADASANTVSGASVHRSSVAASGSAAGTSRTAGAVRLQSKPPRVAVKNPYATTPAAASTAAGAVAAGASTETGQSTSSSSAAVSRPPPSASGTPRAAVRNPYAPKTAVGKTAPAGSTASGASKAASGEEMVRKAQEFAAWKERVLASMENKMTDDKRQEDVGAVDFPSSPASHTAAAPAAAPASGAAGGVLGGTSTAGTTPPTAVRVAETKKSTQPSLTSFFAPKGQENAKN